MGIDEFGIEFGRKDSVPQTDFERAIAGEDEREQLEALRDLLAHELAGNRCKSCRMSQMRQSDLAALSLRLQKVLEALRALPPKGEEVSTLDRIRGRRGDGVPEA